MRWALAFVALAASSAQSPPLLDRVKARAQENLQRLPDYTCTENIERLIHADRERRLRYWDTIRLNVAYVGGKELFGVAGTGKVDDANIDKMVRGTIGNGQFAIFVRSIFVENRATFGHASKTKLDGRPAFRFDYTVPAARSGFLVRAAAAEAIVGYSGRFWVARDSLDLMRIVVSADEMPRSLGMKSHVTTTDYGRVVIGSTPFLLPVRSTFDGKHFRGAEDKNITTFEHCRQFVGESVLKFQ
ncbi:MAG TPA: hypothetical protein VME17_02435 [Bryobacteraceae bacterium]|nr:hypothetical protein [Bryobacteraceae bacterium]